MSRSHQEEQNDHECELAAWELLEEAKATANHWIQKAKEAEQAAEDLKAEIDDWKKEYTAERALTDRLAGALKFIEECDWQAGGDHWNGSFGDNRIGPTCDEALAAWKEARSE